MNIFVYDKLWGPSQRVVTLFHNFQRRIQTMAPGGVYDGETLVHGKNALEPSLNVQTTKISTKDHVRLLKHCKKTATWILSQLPKDKKSQQYFV